MSTETISNIKLDTIEDAIEDIRNGKVVIVVDDEDRENEGDFVCAAEKTTPEIINFMASKGRGLICSPITTTKAKDLGLDLMVRHNTALHETAFTVSIDLVGHGCTTGISAYDRATGNRALADDSIKADSFARPGHIFPLVARDGGVLERTGHTEAAVDLARLAGLNPSAVLVEILNEDGTMARLRELSVMAEALGIKLISIKDLVAYRMKNERMITEINRYQLNEKYDGFQVHVFKENFSGLEHIAISYGKWTNEDVVTVRVHASSDQDMMLGLLLSDYGSIYDRILTELKQSGKGVFLLMRKAGLEKEDEILQQVQRCTGQEETKEVKATVQRDFGIGAQILRSLDVRNITILTNSPKKHIALEGYGIKVMGTKLIDKN